MRKVVSVLLCLFFSVLLCAQKEPVFRFGKMNAGDLKRKVYPIDSNAHAVVLADVGRSEIVGNSKGGFSLEFTHFKRVHILHKSAYEYADVEISLYVKDNKEEKLRSLKASTYNLENGAVIESKLEKSGLFTERKDRNHIVKKFTLPNIKEGSVIEYEYKTTSEFLFNLQPWSFQGSIPRLWSEYRLSLPDFMGYIFLTKGYYPYLINDNKRRNTVYNIIDATGAGTTGRYSLGSGVTDYRWVMKDVPQLKEESFTSTLENHKSAIEFQLSEFRYPLTPKKIMQSWPEVAQQMMESEDFGASLYTANSWLSDIMSVIIKGAGSDIEKAKSIFAYVRDHMICTSHHGMEATQSLKNVLKSKKGKVSDINLLLTAMLHYAGIEAEPVVLGTRDHGYVYARYPIMQQYNYVVSRAVIGGKTYYLDASHPQLGFGKLPAECYNGTARIINEEATAVELVADSLKERRVVELILMNDKDGRWAGDLIQYPGYYESFELRNRISEEGKEAFFLSLQKSLSTEAQTLSAKIDSLNNPDVPLAIRYRFSIAHEKEDILYINPMFGEGYKENPFRSAERHYPVEMPYTIDQTYIATINVPEGYEPDELPQQLMVKLNEQGDGVFEYAMAKSEDVVSFRSRLKLTRAFFTPEEYELLREFFNLVVKKHSEQIIFKKKK